MRTERTFLCYVHVADMFNNVLINVYCSYVYFAFLRTVVDKKVSKRSARVRAICRLVSVSAPVSHQAAGHVGIK